LGLHYRKSKVNAQSSIESKVKIITYLFRNIHDFDMLISMMQLIWLFLFLLPFQSPASIPHYVQMKLGLSCRQQMKAVLKSTGFINHMTKTWDVINWYHCQTLSVSMICILYHLLVKLMGFFSRRQWIKAVL
jgi:hypothetical protein